MTQFPTLVTFWHWANQSLPCPSNAERQARQRKVSILKVIDLTRFWNRNLPHGKFAPYRCCHHIRFIDFVKWSYSDTELTNLSPILVMFGTMLDSDMSQFWKSLIRVESGLWQIKRNSNRDRGINGKFQRKRRFRLIGLALSGYRGKIPKSGDCLCSDCIFARA